jgi:hypothetical protein
VNLLLLNAQDFNLILASKQTKKKKKKKKKRVTGTETKPLSLGTTTEWKATTGKHLQVTHGIAWA